MVTTTPRRDTTQRAEQRTRGEGQAQVNVVALSGDEITSATEKQDSTYFTPLSLNIDDEGRLTNCYSINKKIEKVETRHRLNDMHDVFRIVVPEADGKTLIPGVFNLYQDYASLTVEMVAASTQLSEKINDDYATISRESCGGPFYFILLINQILCQTEEAVLALQLRLKRLEIRSVPGEDIDKVISLARAAILRLETFGRVPEDLIRILLKIFKTSSIESFNSIFLHMERQRYLEQALIGGWRTSRRTPYQRKYFSRCAGAIPSAMGGEFLAQQRQTWRRFHVHLHFCGGKEHLLELRGSEEHLLKECKQPHDHKRINTNRRRQQKYFAKKKDDAPALSHSKGAHDKPSNPTGKFRNPAAEERNRRVIDGKPMWFNRRTKKWIPDRNASSNAAMSKSDGVAPLPSSNTTPSTPTSSVSSSNHSTPAAHQASCRLYANAYVTAMQQF